MPATPNLPPIPIDKGIPMPKLPHPHPRGRTRYPWREMEIGDSFFVTGTPQNLRSGFVYSSILAGIRITTSKVTENGVVGTRVWRTE